MDPVLLIPKGKTILQMLSTVNSTISFREVTAALSKRGYLGNGKAPAFLKAWAEVLVLCSQDLEVRKVSHNTQEFVIVLIAFPAGNFEAVVRIPAV